MSSPNSFYDKWIFLDININDMEVNQELLKETKNGEFNENTMNFFLL